MFSGIVEETARVVRIEKEQDNVHLTMSCSFVDQLKIDQSVAHNGVCLTVVRIADGTYTVTAMRETPQMVKRGYFCVDKGSVTVNGVSLTVCNPTSDTFQVCIIPYTYDNTNFHAIQVGTTVNLEFDIIGKYIARMTELANCQ